MFVSSLSIKDMAEPLSGVLYGIERNLTLAVRDASDVSCSETKQLLMEHACKEVADDIQTIIKVINACVVATERDRLLHDMRNLSASTDGGE